MNVTIIAVGNIKEKYLIDGTNEFIKRIKKYSNIKIIEINESKISDLSDKSVEKSLEEEGSKIISKIGDKDYIITLEIEGKQLTSEDFAYRLEDLKIQGNNDFVFIIGSSHGLSDDVKKVSNLKLSFSKMTFPHQLMRLVLLEQIYRCFRISNNEPYHK